MIAMSRMRKFFYVTAAALGLFSVLLPMSAGQAAPQTQNAPATQAPSIKRQEIKAAPTYPAAQVDAGNALFQRDCSFCHGRDAGGGESGPDLTRSKLVADDKNGDKIGSVVRNGRTEKGMPRFTVSDSELTSLVAFIHTQKIKSESQVGGRRGVDTADLQTGNAEAGKRYFETTGGCSGCHSATGDLAGIANRYEGLKLEQRMLYPKNAASKVTVTAASGEPVTGKLAYLDEFTVAMSDESGRYRSWPVKKVQYKVDAPVEAHAALLPKYSDDDIHDLMAYLQTLK